MKKKPMIIMVHHLRELVADRPIEIPVYDYSTHTRMREGIIKKPAKMIILEGILILCEQALRKRSHDES